MSSSSAAAAPPPSPPPSRDAKRKSDDDGAAAASPWRRAGRRASVSPDAEMSTSSTRQRWRSAADSGGAPPSPSASRSSAAAARRPSSSAEKRAEEAARSAAPASSLPLRTGELSCRRTAPATTVESASAGRGRDGRGRVGLPPPPSLRRRLRRLTRAVPHARRELRLRGARVAQLVALALAAPPQVARARHLLRVAPRRLQLPDEDEQLGRARAPLGEVGCHAPAVDASIAELARRLGGRAARRRRRLAQLEQPPAEDLLRGPVSSRGCAPAPAPAARLPHRAQRCKLLGVHVVRADLRRRRL